MCAIVKAFSRVTSLTLACPMKETNLMARMLCHSLIFHSSRVHNHWSQHGKVLGKGALCLASRGCLLTVSSEGKEWEAISLFHCFFSGQWCHPGSLHLHAWWPPRRLYLPMPPSWRLEVPKPSALTLYWPVQDASSKFLSVFSCTPSVPCLFNF